MDLPTYILLIHPFTLLVVEISTKYLYFHVVAENTMNFVVKYVL